MTDGLIEGSAPGGDAGSEYVTVLEGDLASSDTAIAYEGTGVVYEDTAYDDAYTEVESATASSTIAFGDTSGTETEGSERAGCTAGACPHPVAHPAETDWEQLASAVPVECQLGRFKPFCEGMSYPTEDDFRDMRDAYLAVAPDPERFEAFMAKMSTLPGELDWSAADLGSITAPALIIIGDRDFIRVGHAGEMRELIPDARLAVLPDTTHMDLIRRTDLVLPLVERFLAP